MFASWLIGYWLLSEQKKMFFPCQKNANFKQINFNCDVIMTSETPCDIHMEKIINRYEFHICMPSICG